MKNTKIIGLTIVGILISLIAITTTRADSTSSFSVRTVSNSHSIQLPNTVQAIGTTPVGILVPTLTDFSTGVVYSNIFCNVSQMTMAFNRDGTDNTTISLDCYASQVAWSSGKTILLSHSVSLGQNIIVQTKGQVLSTYPPVLTPTTISVSTPIAALSTPTPVTNQFSTWFGPGTYGTGSPKSQAYNMVITIDPFKGSTIVLQ